jgi:hypothetical protein
MKCSKIITLLLVVLFSSCNAQDEANDSIELVYLAQTRGSSINITFKNDSLYLKSNESDESLVLSKQQIEEILEEVSKINLSEISNLKAPSNKRFSDGTLIAKFIIKKESETHTSSEFDHENPPKELKSLYALLKLFIKKG